MPFMSHLAASSSVSVRRWLALATLATAAHVSAGERPASDIVSTDLIQTVKPAVQNPLIDVTNAPADIYASTQRVLIDDATRVRNVALSRGGLAGREGASSDQSSAGVWTHILGSWGHVDGSGDTARFKQSSRGVLIGSDWALGQNGEMGLLAGYNRDHFSVAKHNASGRAEVLLLGAYGGMQWRDWQLRAGAVYAKHDFTTHRSLVAGDSELGLTNDYDAHTAQAFGEIARQFRFGTNVTVEPFASAAYIDTSADDSAERGGEGAVGVAGEYSKTLFTGLGLNSRAQFAAGPLTIQPRGSLAWRHASGDLRQTAQLTSVDEIPVTVTGEQLARSTWATDAGVDLKFPSGLTLSLDTQQEYAHHARNTTTELEISARF